VKTILKTIFFCFLFLALNCGETKQDLKFNISFEKNNIEVSVKNQTSETMQDLFKNITKIVIIIENTTLNTQTTFAVDLNPIGEPPSAIEINGEESNLIAVGESVDSNQDGKIDSYSSVYSYRIFSIKGYDANNLECWTTSTTTETWQFVSDQEQDTHDFIYEINMTRNESNMAACTI
jgi:hypothetical protein